MATNIRIVLFIVLILSSIACNRDIVPTESKGKIFYPAQPEQARIQYLTSFSNSDDISGARSKFSEFIMGPADVLSISKPYGIAIYKGKIFVCDQSNRILEIIDLKNQTFRFINNGGSGVLKQPLNCTIDKDENIYVSDIGSKQIIIFDKDEKVVGIISESEKFRPTDVAVSDEYIYVADPDNNKVNIYSRESRVLVASIPEKAKLGDDDWLYNPMNISLSDNYLYVTDFGHSRIKKFSLLGEYIGSTGEYGRNIGQFTRPKGIAADKEDNLYVVDAAFSNVQIFNKEGQLLLFFGGAYSGNPGEMYMPANVIIDYDNLDYFRDLVDPAYELKYLILVTNQFGPDKVNIYGRIDPK